MADATTLTGEDIVFAWIRSDACGVGLKMMLDRESVDPLVAAIDEAVAAARRDGLEEAARIAEARAAKFVGREREAGWTAETSTGTLHKFQCEEIAADIRAAALAARTGGRADG